MSIAVAAPQSKPDVAPAEASALTPEILAALFEHMGDIVSFPALALRVIQLAGNNEAGAGELIEAVKGDPALVVKILRTVNSSRYALKGSVKDIGQAVSLLGHNEVRNMALTIHTSRLYDRSTSYGSYKRQALWEHLVSVGVTAEALARRCNKPVADEAYLAGLLHDIGLVLVDQALQKHFRLLIDRLDEATPTVELERRIFKFDHTQVGEHAARRWQFADSIISAIRYHHDPLAHEGPDKDVVFLVCAANYLCACKGVTSLGVVNIATPPMAVFEYLGMGRDDLSEFWNELEQTLERATSLAAL